MISFNNLGNYGRLGNQMFQYASLKGIAAHHNYHFVIPDEKYFGIKDANVAKDEHNIHNTFNLSCKTAISSNPTYTERCYEFDEHIFNNCPDNVDLAGYFQTEKYFKHIENEIRGDFSFHKSPVYTDACNKINIIKSQGKIDQSDINSQEIISLHIRRGDYLNFPNHHPVPSMDYYRNALTLLPYVNVLIFSDDIDWCMKQPLFQSSRFLFSASKSAALDMCMMTLCDYHIIANSSFSWWGAWLSNSKQVIAPKNWFGPAIQHNTCDLYCEGWIKL